MKLVAILSLAAAPAFAAPVPLDGQSGGWGFAACQMDAICRFEAQSCGTFQSPGETYLWRDENGIRLGSSLRTSNPVAAYDSLSSMQTELSPESDGSVLVMPPEEAGPGWFRMILVRVRDGVVADTHFSLTCETSAEPPPELPDDPAPRPEGGEEPEG